MKALSIKTFAVQSMPWVLACLSGLLLTLAFPPFEQDWFGWVAFFPIALLPTYREVTIKQAVALGYVFGLVHFLSSLFWLTEVSVLGWAALCLYLSFYPAAWYLFWCHMFHPMPARYGSVYNISRALLGASAWVCLEWLRGWVLTGFPWNFVGVSQIKVVGLLQVAEFGGIYLVTWLVLQVGLTLCMTVRRLHSELLRKQRTNVHMEFTFGILLIGCAFMYGMQETLREPEVSHELKFLAVQPDLPQDPWGQGISTEKALEKFADLTELGMFGREIDLIVWPETPIPQSILYHPDFQDLFLRWNEDEERTMLFGSHAGSLKGVYNAAVLLQGISKQPQTYYKNHLVPMGEYVPFGDTLPFLRKFVPLGDDFSAGKEMKILTFAVNGQETRVAPLICFEDTMGRLARRAANLNPDLFVNLTNGGWFGRSAQTQQHLQNALPRTVEFRRPMLRVANNGVTCVITDRGVISQKLFDPVTESTHDAGILRGSVQISTHTKKTFYARFGNWFPLLCGLLCLIVLLKKYFRTKRE
ncbi:MAG: apolipoprotein N-acyltransferase [Verrucomicrobiota bacterium]